MRLVQPFIRYNYLANFKKPVTSMPTTQPPKYIYYPQYHPASMPDFDMKYKDHPHLNPWYDIAYGQQDKYSFQYSGQWWDSITVTGRIGWAVLLIGIWVLTVQSSFERKKKHLPGILSSHPTGQLPAACMPIIMQN